VQKSSGLKDGSAADSIRIQPECQTIPGELSATQKLPGCLAGTHPKDAVADGRWKWNNLQANDHHHFQNASARSAGLGQSESSGARAAQ